MWECIYVWMFVVYLWWGGQCHQTTSSIPTAPCLSCTAASWEGSCSLCRSPWTCSDPASAQPTTDSSDTLHRTWGQHMHSQQQHRHATHDTRTASAQPATAQTHYAWHKDSIRTAINRQLRHTTETQDVKNNFSIDSRLTEGSVWQI